MPPLPGTRDDLENGSAGGGGSREPRQRFFFATPAAAAATADVQRVTLEPVVLENGSSIKGSQGFAKQWRRCRISWGVLPLRPVHRRLTLCLLVFVGVLCFWAVREADPSTRRAAILAASLYLSSSPLVLLASVPRPPSSAVCSETTFAFVREFYVPSMSPGLEAKDIEFKTRRLWGLVTATRLTMVNNPCGKMVLVVQDPAYATAPLPPELWLLLPGSAPRSRDRKHLSMVGLLGAMGVEVEAYWAPGGTVTYDRLFLAAQLAMPRPDGAFVTSTGDIIISPLERLKSVCSAAFQERSPALLVVSRRNLPPGDGSCDWYRSMGSWDVFIGRMSLITRSVLDSTIFSPSYWGVENVLGYMLSPDKYTAYNMCGYIDAAHLSERDDVGRARIRINHPENAIFGTAGNLANVCNETRLPELVIKADTQLPPWPDVSTAAVAA